MENLHQIEPQHQDTHPDLQELHPDHQAMHTDHQAMQPAPDHHDQIIHQVIEANLVNAAYATSDNQMQMQDIDFSNLDEEAVVVNSDVEFETVTEQKTGQKNPHWSMEQRRMMVEFMLMNEVRFLRFLCNFGF